VVVKRPVKKENGITVRSKHLSQILWWCCFSLFTLALVSSAWNVYPFQ